MLKVNNRTQIPPHHSLARQDGISTAREIDGRDCYFRRIEHCDDNLEMLRTSS